MSATSSLAVVNGNGHAALNNGVGHHALEAPLPESHESGISNQSASEPVVNGYLQQSLYQLHNEAIVNHLYHSGFQTGNYADTILHFHQNAFRLHAIILSRSPFLAHLMSTSPQTGSQRVIYVDLEQEPEITLDGFAIALGYLYSSISLRHVSPQNARTVLAAGCLLGGMDDLCEYAYEMCVSSITVDTINEWLEFIDTIPGATDGTSTPVEMPARSVFGPYAQRLRDEVFHFLVVTLPIMLEVNQTSAADPTSAQGAKGRDVLLHVFSRVPFEMFKAAVESATFQIGSDQARFKFAKEAIEIRKRGIARGQGAEETVVLAFGNTGGSAVHVTRKIRKRPLWKVNS